ncbi:ribosomal 40S subunit protein S11A [Malassezia cuniculi]|uniref:Ribosomal 40S subunit protein S11A n=1 Tax=Malassezia cuniculi TaxID=948313 RepID=A0AAF0EXS7_9BASI|nr:ribosomal 40S subunit protein S11A [Malassezia cuniculi]
MSSNVELGVQTEKAFQKQPLFLNSKAARKSTRARRWYKDVGLGFKTPSAAIYGYYIDKKCPWTGLVSIRGRILSGKVVSTKMTRTVIIRREYLHYVPKYNRYERRHRNLPVHVSPAFRVEVGDIIVAGQCRPLSKTVRFNALRVIKNKSTERAKAFNRF